MTSFYSICQVLSLVIADIDLRFRLPSSNVLALSMPPKVTTPWPACISAIQFDLSSALWSVNLQEGGISLTRCLMITVEEGR